MIGRTEGEWRAAGGQRKRLILKSVEPPYKTSSGLGGGLDNSNPHDINLVVIGQRSTGTRILYDIFIEESQNPVVF